MLLRARGKKRVERVSIAGLARRPTGASAKRWLSHGAKQTHVLTRHLRGQALRDFRAAIDAGTSTALVKPLSKANTYVVITARPRRPPSSMRENSEQPLQRDPNALSASKANALLRLSPNAPMNGAGVRSTEASVPVAG